MAISWKTKQALLNCVAKGSLARNASLLTAVGVAIPPEIQILSGWSYCKSHVINQQAGAPANYAVMIKVYKGVGVDGTEVVDLWTAGKVYCAGNCRDDFGDIRFTDNNGKTLLAYWLHEDYTVAGTSQVFWVRLYDDVSAGNVTIYIHYGNPTATTTSSISDTLTIGDSFDGSAEPPEGWTETIIGAGTWLDITQNSIYKLYTFAGPAAWKGNEIEKVAGTPATFEACLRSKTYCGPPMLPQLHSVLEGHSSGVMKFQIGYVDAWQVNTGRMYSMITGTVNSVLGISGVQDKRYTIRRDGTNVKTYYDNTLLGDKAETQTIDELVIRSVAGVIDSPTNPQTEHYWVYYRGFVDPEPSHGGWGAEES